MRPDSAPAAARWPYALAGTAPLLWIAQAALLARALAALLDWQLAGGLAQGTASAPWGMLTVAAAGVALLGLLRAALEYVAARVTWRSARTQLTALRQEFGQRLRAASPLDARRPPSGQLASAWMEQAEAIVPWLANYRTAQWRVMLVPPVLLVFVAWHSWAAALLLALAAPLIPLFMALIGWKAQAVSEALGHTLAQRTMRVLRIAMLSSAVLELFSAIGVALVAVYVGFHLLGEVHFGAWRGSLNLERGLFVLMLAPAFFEPLRELSAVWHDRANGLAAQRSLSGLLDGLAPMVAAESQEHEHAGGGDKQKSNEENAAPSVELRGVHPALPFADANSDAPARAALDVHIPAGAHVAVTGASGSGKSMVLALLAGLLQPAEGQVLIDGAPLDGTSAAALRQRMGWQGQPPHFIAGSLARNLNLGGEAPPTKAAHTALHAAGLDDFIARMEGMRLGEGGSGISGGEALRLALARLAVAGSAESIRLLLLDEPTAHLDAASAAQVRDAITRMARGCTLLAATHDPALIAALPFELRLATDGHAELLDKRATAQGSAT